MNSMICPYCGKLITYNSFFDVFYCLKCGGFFKQATVMKCNDLNEPLTLDEIRQINEAIEPVYLYIFGSDFDSGWQIIEQITDTKIIFRGKTNTYVPIKELGISYNLDRQKPNEETL